jgi:aminodeoxyfutalosine deaminase
MASTSFGVIDVIIAGMIDGLQAMPKAELHVHLEGSIEAEALMEIDPALTHHEIAANTMFNTFDGFLRAYIWVNSKLKIPEHYAIATRCMLDRFRHQGIVYAEVTLSAGMVLWKEQSLADVYDAVWRESLRSQVEVRWIPDAIRHFGPELGLEVAKFAVSRKDDGVVAFGIGGDEVRGPAAWFRDVFAFVRDNGLHLVCHAGETAGPESVWAALEIGAERIGHGIAAARDPHLMAHLRDRNVPLEVCTTSNVRTGAVATLQQHPIRVLYEAGVPITLNTDDPALFGTTLAAEFHVAESEFGFTADELKGIVENGFRYGFACPATHALSKR